MWHNCVRKILLWSQELQHSKQVWLYLHDHMSASCTCFGMPRPAKWLLSNIQTSLFLHISVHSLSHLHTGTNTRACVYPMDSATMLMAFLPFIQLIQFPSRSCCVCPLNSLLVTEGVCLSQVRNVTDQMRMCHTALINPQSRTYTSLGYTGRSIIYFDIFLLLSSNGPLFILRGVFQSSTARF